MKMIKQPTIPPMPKRPTFDARDTQYNLPIGTDLISRQMLLEYIHGEPVGRLLCDKYNLDGLIEQLPPIQPEIVRCKDCKYAEYIDDVQTLWCTECGQGRTVAPYDFCSYGERREDG